MPRGLRGKITHSGRAPAGAQSFRFETSLGAPQCRSLFFQSSGWYAIRGKPAPRVTSIFERVAPFAPIANSAVHGNDIRVSHFLQVIGGQRGAEAAATIQYERSFEIRILAFNVALDDALAQVDGSRQVVGVEFAVFTDVDKNEFLFAIKPGFDFVNVSFTNALLGVVDNLQKARWMLMSHGRRSPLAGLVTLGSLRMIAGGSEWP